MQSKSKIYLDNAATSFPKATGIETAVSQFITSRCVNINRGMYSLSHSAQDVVYDTRVMLSKLFDCSDNPEQFSKQIIFTSGITSSVNMFLRGLLKKGDHVVTGSMEHHAVMRTLYALKDEREIAFDCADADNCSVVSPKSIENSIKENTKAVIINHASNVFGGITDIYQIGKICKKYGVFFAVDTAQTAGCVDISMRKCNIDFLAFSGHKGLLALQGIGGFAISKQLNDVLIPSVTGGTGSFSDIYSQPDLLPDKFESGTLNLPGIAALNHSLRYINSVKISNIRAHETKLRRKFIDGIKNIDGVKIYCKDLPDDTTTAIVSVSFDNIDNALASFLLEDKYGIMTRSGLHCALSAHKAMGSYPRGTVRFSFGCFNTNDDVDFTVNAVREICEMSHKRIDFS